MEFEYKQRWLTLRAENQAERIQLRGLAHSMREDWDALLDRRVAIVPPDFDTLKDHLSGVQEITFFITRRR